MPLICLYKKMNIGFNIHIIIIIIIYIAEYCQCCRYVPKESSPGRNKYILNVKVASIVRDRDKWDGKSVKGIDFNSGQEFADGDVIVRYDENDEIEVICERKKLPPKNYLVWHQKIIDNITFATPQQDQGYMPYTLKLHMDKVDDRSYVYCTARYQGVDVVKSKNIHFLLNGGSASSDFSNFIPEYFNDYNTIKPHICEEGYTVVKNSTTGIVSVYSGKIFNTSLSISDSGTLIACGHFKNNLCQNEFNKCEVERVFDNKYIYLYTNSTAELTYHKNSLLHWIIIAGVSVSIIIISVIIVKIFCRWNNRRRSAQQVNDSTYATCEPPIVIYADLQLTESYRTQRRPQNNDASYTTIAGVLTTT